MMVSSTSCIGQGLELHAIAASGRLVVLISSDCATLASWLNAEGWRDLLALTTDLTYMQAAASGCYTVLFWFEGTAVACSWTFVGLM